MSGPVENTSPAEDFNPIRGLAWCCATCASKAPARALLAPSISSTRATTCGPSGTEVVPYLF